MTGQTSVRLAALGLTTLVLSAAFASAASRTGAAELASAVSGERLRATVEMLASDACEGRGPGSAGSARAVAWLEARLEELGLEPLGEDGGYRQGVPMVVSEALPGTTLELVSLGGRHLLERGVDYLLLTSGDQTQLPRALPLVFVGWGITAPEFDHDDYAELDVRGRVVVFLDGEPPSDDPEWFAGVQPTVYSAPEAKQRIALAHGAAGSVLLPVGREAAARWSRRARAHGFPSVLPAADLPRHLAVSLSPAWAAELFSDALYDLEQVTAMQQAGTLRPFHLPWTIRFEGEFSVRTLLEPNLIGRLPGGDPRVAESCVVVSAHWDHLGRGPQVEGDGIYNGAIDNAIGVAGALEILRVLSARPAPTRRSVVLLLTAGEEAGLLGARRFLERPPVRLGQMVANVNVDGLAFLSPFRDLIAVGGELSDLGERLERAVEPLGLAVAPPPEEVWSSEAFGYSDQLAFAERGVPAVLVNEGFDWPGASREEALQRSLAWMLEVYHSPFDEPGQPIDWEAARVHAGALAALVANLADGRRVPEWRPGVPYAYQRLLSLAEERGR